MAKAKMTEEDKTFAFLMGKLLRNCNGHSPGMAVSALVAAAGQVTCQTSSTEEEGLRSFQFFCVEVQSIISEKLREKEASTRRRVKKLKTKLNQPTP